MWSMWTLPSRIKNYLFWKWIKKSETLFKIHEIPKNQINGLLVLMKWIKNRLPILLSINETLNIYILHFFSARSALK